MGGVDHSIPKYEVINENCHFLTGKFLITFKVSH